MTEDPRWFWFSDLSCLSTTDQSKTPEGTRGRTIISSRDALLASVSLKAELLVFSCTASLKERQLLVLLLQPLAHWLVNVDMSAVHSRLQKRC